METGVCNPQGATMGTENQIRQYVNENLLFGDDRIHYENDSSFLQNGLIDSMGVMELVAFVQSAFDIHVDPMEITPDNFDTINKLAAYIARKQSSICSSTTA
jgi:acyl carrier protein